MLDKESKEKRIKELNFEFIMLTFLTVVVGIFVILFIKTKLTGG